MHTAIRFKLSILGLQLLHLILLVLPHGIFLDMLWIALGFGRAPQNSVTLVSMKGFHYAPGFSNNSPLVPFYFHEERYCYLDHLQLSGIQRLLVFIVAFPAAIVSENFFCGPLRRGVIQDLILWLDTCYIDLIRTGSIHSEIRSPLQTRAVLQLFAPHPNVRTAVICGIDIPSAPASSMSGVFDAPGGTTVDARKQSRSYNTRQPHTHTSYRKSILVQLVQTSPVYTRKACGLAQSERSNRITSDQLRVVGFPGPRPPLHERIYRRVQMPFEDVLHSPLVDNQVFHLSDAPFDEGPWEGYWDEYGLRTDSMHDLEDAWQARRKAEDDIKVLALKKGIAMAQAQIEETNSEDNAQEDETTSSETSGDDVSDTEFSLDSLSDGSHSSASAQFTDGCSSSSESSTVDSDSDSDDSDSYHESSDSDYHESKSDRDSSNSDSSEDSDYGDVMDIDAERPETLSSGAAMIPVSDGLPRVLRWDTDGDVIMDG
ncbi:hypothetical protein EW146_g767 [Bondarzewia mesenterica]|uniref:Uncharacterized protein n=1 Tax=Bondarzewia mesenterica TaxID=1095465 RepID=A0A4S4M5Z2_9AGAM|nr:hypothetical protein EW146_g767 [Bondarzewia mesenterica]